MASKKTKKQPIVEAPIDVKPESKKSYHLYVKLNDRVFESDTDDLVSAINSLRPSLLKTSLTIRVTKGNKTVDRYMYLNDGRRLFSNRIALEAFVRNLLF